MNQTITYYITGSSKELRASLRELLFRDPTRGTVNATITLVAIADADMHQPQPETIAHAVAVKLNMQNVTVRAVTSD